MIHYQGYQDAYHHHHHGVVAAQQQQHDHVAAAAAAAAAVMTSASAASGLDPRLRPQQQQRLFFKMPRVVPNQRERFETDDFYKRNSKDMEVRYTLFRDRPASERQAKLLTGCREGHIEVSHTQTGLVLLLTWNPNDSQLLGPRGICDFEKEPGKVHLSSSLILNGVCVRWRGFLDLQRLDGIGRIEFDQQMAKAEDAVVREQGAMYQRHFRELEDQERRRQEHLHHIKKLAYSG